jgi:hypothetical protein
MSRATSTLTDARLDRVADISRDLGAVATALHDTTGASVEAALECARETFRVGETVRQWWGRAVATVGQPADGQDVAKEGPTDDLYGDDILWSERQADLLRRRAAGELVDDAELDWPNIAEAIASMGRSELRSCRSLVRQALRCMLKAEAWPLSKDAPTWRADAIDFRRQARDAFTPSMRQRIDLAGLYADALAATPETLDGQAPLPLPETCPVTLDELLGEP